MSRQLLVIATLGTAAVGGSAEGGFLGFVFTARQIGTYVMVDVFAGVSNSSDRLLNVYNANITTTNVGGFYQASGLSNKTWKPDTASFSSTRSSIDSFMTAGTYSGGAYSGEYYASANTNGDPNFTGTSWSPTPASPAATTIPTNAGWYTGDPTSIDNNAESLFVLGSGRNDSGPTSAGDGCAASVGSAGASFGIWVSHLVLANASIDSSRIVYSACVSIKDGMTGAVDQRISTFVIPAPGAIALLGIGGIAVRRRRR